MAIFPANRPELVQALIDKLSGEIDPDSPIVVEAFREVKGNRVLWQLTKRFLLRAKNNMNNFTPYIRLTEIPRYPVRVTLN